MFTKKKSWLRFTSALSGMLGAFCVFLYGHYTGDHTARDYGVAFMIVMFVLATASAYFGFKPEE